MFGVRCLSALPVLYEFSKSLLYFIEQLSPAETALRQSDYDTKT